MQREQSVNRTPVAEVLIVDARGGALHGASGPEVQNVLQKAGCKVSVIHESGEAGVMAAARDVDGMIFTGRISRRLMTSLTRCRVIATSSIGMDTVEGIDVATEKGIVLCNMPGVIEEEVADHAFALLLACARRIALQDHAVRDGSWERAAGIATAGMPRVFGATLGIVGLGRIGSAMARRARGFSMRILATDPEVGDETFERLGVRRGTLGEVLQEADYVSLHVPLEPATRHLVGAPELRLMKASAILVNTSRGPVVDEIALVDALKTGEVAGAALDVMEEEPIGPDHPLCRLENVVLTPHIASRSEWTDRERHLRPAEEVAAVLNGLRPRAVWNPEVLSRLDLR
jgi:D-3-phosphoglycerate dehydrogenase